MLRYTCTNLVHSQLKLTCRFSSSVKRIFIPEGGKVQVCAAVKPPFLAHRSQRLIGELIVYPCTGVHPSSTTISKIFSETAGPIVLILYIHHLQVGRKNNCVFCFDRIRTLVTMVTYASHRLIMEKSENCQILLSCWRY